MKTIAVKNISALNKAAGEILVHAGEKKVLCFYGELGAGKTTLIKELCKLLGASDPGSSPTFSLINEYAAKSGKPLYHFDLYRLKSESEIYDIGYEEYLFSGNFCFIEWPEKMEHLLPQDVVKVRINVKNSERIITVE